MQKCGNTAALHDHKSCKYPLYIDSSYRTVAKCDSCDEFLQLVRCRGPECVFRTEVCPHCLTNKSQQQKFNSQVEPKRNSFLYIAIAVVLGLLGIICMLDLKNSTETPLNKSLIGRFRERFPSQKKETWYHIMSVLEQENPTVKSIMLLYKNDSKTSDCLVRELVNVFRRDVRLQDVRFDVDGIEFRDYGEVLERYLEVVKRHRVLVTNLNTVSGKLARVFHSLCDEVSSDIKPSLFIFILQLNEETKNLRPLEKATAILKKAWGDLPDSDIFPLLSRVVKNVVDVLPEKRAVC